VNATAAEINAPEVTGRTDTVYTAAPTREDLPSARIYYTLTGHEWYARGQPLVHENAPYSRRDARQRVAHRDAEGGRVPRGRVLHSAWRRRRTLYVPVFEGYWQPFHRRTPGDAAAHTLITYTGAAAIARPPRLRDGSRIALVAPAGPMAPERVDIALDRCRRFGLEPVLGTAARATPRLPGRADDERLADLQQALDDPDIDAVWALRGGYGTMRLLHRLDLAPLARSPGVHRVQRQHGRAPGAARARRRLVPRPARGRRRRIWRAVRCAACCGILNRPACWNCRRSGRPSRWPAAPPRARWSAATSRCSRPCAARRQRRRSHGAILFVEEWASTAYRLDRAWMQLLLARALDGVAGIAFGRFTDCGDDVVELLRSWRLTLGVPVLPGCRSATSRTTGLCPLGVRARLDATHGTLELLEPAVT
jgi:muramoyltetrapeptide carboxypeptidase